MQGYTCLLGRRHARPRPGPDWDKVWRGTGEPRVVDHLLEVIFILRLIFLFFIRFSALDVPQSPVPERQYFWRARVLGQVQRSGGESAT